MQIIIMYSTSTLRLLGHFMTCGAHTTTASGLLFVHQMYARLIKCENEFSVFINTNVNFVAAS